MLIFFDYIQKASACLSRYLLGAFSDMSEIGEFRNVRMYYAILTGDTESWNSSLQV